MILRLERRAQLSPSAEAGGGVPTQAQVADLCLVLAARAVAGAGAAVLAALLWCCLDGGVCVAAW